MPKNAHNFDVPPPHALGEPERPKSLPRAQRRAWNRLCAELLAARKLYQDDGPLLLEWLQATADQYKGTGATKARGRKRAAEIAAKFEARQAAPKPAAAPENGTPEPTVSLEGFLADVRIERASYPDRLVPGQTVCLVQED